MAFPADWPESCPPADAGDASGMVFRAVSKRPPPAEDFRTYRELGRPDRGKPCIAAALSVFATALQCRHNLDKYPYLGIMVARGMLTPALGKISQPRERDGHMSWWPALGVTRASAFVVE